MILIRKFSIYSTSKEKKYSFIETEKNSQGIQVPKITPIDCSINYNEDDTEKKPNPKYANLKTTYAFYLDFYYDDLNRPVRGLIIRTSEEQGKI